MWHTYYEGVPTYVRRDHHRGDATSPGEGGIGIIRISGMQAADVADRVFHTKKIKSFHEAEPYRMYFGRVMEGDRQVDEGLAVYMRSPHSYTGEDVVEIQIHGSMEALRQTLSLVLEKGAVPAHRGEFTKRAFLNGRSTCRRRKP